MRGRYQSGRYQSDGSDPYGIGTANCEVAANMLIGLTNQVTYLLKHQIEKLEREFVEQGGFPEHLCQANSKFKRMSDRSDPSDSPDKPAPPPDCPHCGKPMRRRTAQKGPAPANRSGGAPNTLTAPAPPGRTTRRVRAIHAVDAGIASVADVDTAVTEELGLRWALTGPLLTIHPSGGEGGLHHQLQHLGPSVESWWADLGSPQLTPQVCEKLVTGTDTEIDSRSFTDLVQERDALLVNVLESTARGRTEHAP